MRHAIGLFELNSIAKGIEVADAMMKAAFVDLLGAHPICPGKYLVMVSGEIGDIRTAIQAGREVGEPFITDELVLADVHSAVFPAITATTDVDHLEALGIVETFSCPTCVVAADAAAKAALVKLIEIRLASGLGGKAFFTLTGEVG
ncbi:MAG: BMC domain-containing protein, partial [bacterium]|nr:BMC domain-containing protein [bacterium]